MGKAKSVLVIGGGIAGLSASTKLTELNIRSVLIEKLPFLGGHAVQYSCKATDACVTCGACVVEEKWRQVVNAARIDVWTGSRVVGVSRNGRRYRFVIAQGDNEESCGDIHVEADAVIVATGFKPFDPAGKPYGYKHFANVVTNLELECMLRENGSPYCPSDDRHPDKIAFVQCVGSRDAKLGHLWCSKACCASALRMARLIKTRRPETQITIFYIDIQTFGKDFNTHYAQLQTEMKMVRALPGDIIRSEGDRLRIVYFNPAQNQGCEDHFDMVVLSVGITPSPQNRMLADLLQLPTKDTGFLEESARQGIFIAGAAGGPMTIAESVASAGRAVSRVASYLRGVK